RRRHTRFSRDWSSDVCSSDLVAEQINIPFTIGGGITEISDAEALLNAGADKISINSAAVRNPDLIKQLSDAFGKQFVVVAVDSRLIDEQNFVHLNGGRLKTDWDTFEIGRASCRERV